MEHRERHFREQYESVPPSRMILILNCPCAKEIGGEEKGSDLTSSGPVSFFLHKYLSVIRRLPQGHAATPKTLSLTHLEVFIGNREYWEVVDLPGGHCRSLGIEHSQLGGRSDGRFAGQVLENGPLVSSSGTPNLAWNFGQRLPVYRGLMIRQLPLS